MFLGPAGLLAFVSALKLDLELACGVAGGQDRQCPCPSKPAVGQRQDLTRLSLFLMAQGMSLIAARLAGPQGPFRLHSKVKDTRNPEPKQ